MEALLPLISKKKINGCRIMVSSGVHAGKHYVTNIPGIHDPHYPTALCLDMGSIGVSSRDGCEAFTENLKQCSASLMKYRVTLSWAQPKLVDDSKQILGIHY